MFLIVLNFSETEKYRQMPNWVSFLSNLLNFSLARLKIFLKYAKNKNNPKHDEPQYTFKNIFCILVKKCTLIFLIRLTDFGLRLVSL